MISQSSIGGDEPGRFCWLSCDPNALSVALERPNHGPNSMYLYLKCSKVVIYRRPRISLTRKAPGGRRARTLPAPVWPVCVQVLCRDIPPLPPNQLCGRLPRSNRTLLGKNVSGRGNSDEPHASGQAGPNRTDPPSSTTAQAFYPGRSPCSAALMRGLGAIEGGKREGLGPRWARSFAQDGHSQISAAAELAPQPDAVLLVGLCVGTAFVLRGCFQTRLGEPAEGACSADDDDGRPPHSNITTQKTHPHRPPS